MHGKKRFIKLSPDQYSALELGHKNGKKATFRQRCHYILLSNQGKNLKTIADIYKTNRQTVANWFDRYETSGIEGLHTAKGKGRPSIIRIDNEAEVAKIEGWVENNAQNLNAVLAKIEDELGKDMHKRTLQRFLKKKSGFGSDFARKCQTSQIRKNSGKKPEY